jgi:hypothetical protein
MAIAETNRPDGNVQTALSKLGIAFTGLWGDTGTHGSNGGFGGFTGLVTLIVGQSDSFMNPNNNPDMVFPDFTPSSPGVVIGGDPFAPRPGNQSPAPEQPGNVAPGGGLPDGTPGAGPSTPESQTPGTGSGTGTPGTGQPDTGTPGTGTGTPGTNQPGQSGGGGGVNPPDQNIVVEQPSRDNSNNVFFQVGVNKDDAWRFDVAQVSAVSLGLADSSGNSLIDVVNNSVTQNAINRQRIDSAISFVVSERVGAERVGAQLSNEATNIVTTRDNLNIREPWSNVLERIRSLDQATSDRMVRMNFLEQMARNLRGPEDILLNMNQKQDHGNSMSDTQTPEYPRQERE